ncbi:MAG TPA: polysaccharide deacetylase family protein [Terriglobia bacterium]|jgi:peptidoglycan/xylan/chitin deacetylase (PgdA/CDA1 family)|nr:polysaccharide deacetylase family protein [Terriglobia bacterium]
MTPAALAGSVLGPLAAGGSFVYYACSVPTSQVLGKALVRGPAGGREVVLTFDDGPAEPFTGQILDILRRYRAPAAFFCCGKNAARFPDAVRRAATEGHAVGNHTWSHPLLYMKGRRRIEDEIDRAQETLERATGRAPAVFRPPYGVRWFGLFPALRARGLTDVQWSDTGYDWKPRHGAADVARLALAKLRPGAVILLHDGREPREPGRVDASTTVAALPAIIEGVRRAGLELAPIERFLPAAGESRA